MSGHEVFGECFGAFELGCGLGWPEYQNTRYNNRTLSAIRLQTSTGGVSTFSEKRLYTIDERLFRSWNEQIHLTKHP